MSTAQVALVISAAAGLVGLYGAINSARALRWQRARDVERRELRAHVEIEHEASNMPSDDSAEGTVDKPAEMAYRLRIAIVNDSEEQAIFVREFHLWDASGALGIGAGTPCDDVKLEPRQRYVRVIALSEMAIRNLKGGFVARAKLTSGEMIEASGRLDPEMIRRLHRANRGTRRRAGEGHN